MRGFLLLGVMTWLLPVASAHADLAQGREKLAHGDYKEAIASLEDTDGKDRQSARLLEIEALMRIGEYQRAEKIARKLASAPGARGVRGEIALAEVLRQVGQYAEARRLLEGVAARPAPPLRARYDLGLLYRDIGEMDASDKLFKGIYDDYRARKLDEKDPEQLFYLAEAGRYRESFQFANSFYSDALSLDASFHRANLEFGHMLLYKYNVGDAEQSFDAVLKIDPNNPDAHAGIARVKLEQSYDLAAAMHHLTKALSVNPHHIPSLEIRAELETDKNQWDKAIATLNEILSINPNHTGAHAQLATVYWLRDDDADYQAEKSKVFAINPKFAEFFHIVARSAVREHRYTEAIELEREAIAVDPTYYLAMAEIGTGYLRLGQEAKGLEWLRKAYDRDQYNVRTVNLLDLFEKVIPKSYVFVESKHFRFRLHSDEKDIYERYVAPMMERAFADMVKRYGFEPKTPITVELYQDPDHYSVRTVGLPNLGALGVCFGQVITARAPSVGNLNWGMVLWHELSHVFAIQLSRSRVPRWFTEGLSEYETMIARPEWRRENDADLYSAMLAGRIPSVAELNYGFMKPDMQEVVVAYYLSAVTMEYLADVYGFEKIVDGLKLFGQGLETPEVIEKITGKSVASFDKEFRAYLERRLAPYANTFRLPSSGYTDLEALQAAVKKSPRSAKAWTDLALGRFFDGDAREAEAAAAEALELDGKNPTALYLSAELALRSNRIDDARKLYEKMIRVGADGAEVRGRLGMIAAHDDDEELAEKYFCAAKKLDPERSYPYEALAEIYFDEGKDDQALKELETFVYLEQMQYTPLKKLVAELAKRKRWAKVVHFGEMAVFINPSDADVLMELGQAYLSTKHPDEALYSYDSALLAKPALRRPATAHAGRAAALAALGRKREARKAAKKALALEPNNAQALDIAANVGSR